MIDNYFHMNLNRNFSIVFIWINGGSNMDEYGKKGINQILCSLLTRGCKGYENLQFSEFIDSYGAELNNETLEDGMLISLKSLNEHFEKLYPLLNLTINNPNLSKIQFENVKKSTLNAIKKERENPFSVAFDKWKKLVYINHPYAFSLMGYKKEVLELTHSDILREYERFKNRNKYLISNNSKIIEKSSEYSKKISSGEKIIFKNINFKNKDRCVSTFQKSNQIILMIGNQTCSQISHDFLPLKVLESHLAFGMSSVLFKLFREKNGLTYDVGIFNPLRKENAPFLVYLSVSNKNALLAFKLLYELWQKILTSPLTEKEISLAKNKLKSSFLISNQSLDEILQRKIQLIGYGLGPNFDENLLSKIEQVNPQEILRVTKKYFTKPNLSVLGDEKICNQIKINFKKIFEI